MDLAASLIVSVMLNCWTVTYVLPCVVDHVPIARFESIADAGKNVTMNAFRMTIRMTIRINFSLTTSMLDKQRSTPRGRVSEWKKKGRELHKPMMSELCSIEPPTVEA